MSPMQAVMVFSLIKLKWALMWMLHYAHNLTCTMRVIVTMMKFG